MERNSKTKNFRNGAAVFIIVAIVISLCNLKKDQSDIIKNPEVIFKTNEHLSDLNAQAIENAIINYSDQYDSVPQRFVIAYGNNGIHPIEVLDDSNIIDSPLATLVTPGVDDTLFVMSGTFTAFDSITNIKSADMEEAVSHQIFHCIIPSDTAFIPNLWKMQDGSAIIGYQGLRIIIRYADGSTGSVTGIEESAAELCTAQVNFDYKSLSPQARLLYQKIIEKNLSENDLILFQQHSDVIGFVAKWKRLTRGSVNYADLEDTVKEFNLQYPKKEKHDSKTKRIETINY